VDPHKTKKIDDNTSVFVGLNEVMEREVAVKEAIREEKGERGRKKLQRVCWNK